MVPESGEDEFGMREWLNGVRTGFGEKYATCFEDLGCDNKADLTQIGAREWRELESNLREFGVKTMHLNKIKTAIERLGGKMTTERFPLSHFHFCHTHELKSLSSKREDEFQEMSMYVLAFAFIHCQNPGPPFRVLTNFVLL